MNVVRNRRDMLREKVGNAMALLLLILIGLLAFMGPSGLIAWSDNASTLEAHKDRIAALEEERAVLANRVELLDPENADPDLASELARRDLNVVHQDEYVVELDQQP